MKIKDAVFVTSVASADKFVKTDKPIIAVAGKSNVGKSLRVPLLASNAPDLTRIAESLQSWDRRVRPRLVWRNGTPLDSRVAHG